MINLTKFITTEQNEVCTFNELIKLYDLESWKLILQPVLENINKIDNIDDKRLDVTVIEDKKYISLDISILNSKSIILKFNKQDKDEICLNYAIWNNGNPSYINLNSISNINLISNMILSHIESSIENDNSKISRGGKGYIYSSNMVK